MFFPSLPPHFPTHSTAFLPDYPSFPDVAHRSGRPQRGAQRLRGQIGPALLAIGVAALVSVSLPGPVEYETAAMVDDAAAYENPAAGGLQGDWHSPSQALPAQRLGDGINPAEHQALRMSSQPPGQPVAEPADGFFEFGFDSQLGVIAPYGAMFDQRGIEQGSGEPQWAGQAAGQQAVPQSDLQSDSPSAARSATRQTPARLRL